MDIALKTTAGTPVGALGTREGAAFTQQYGTSFAELVRRGNVYACANQSGVTSQAGLSGTTPVLALYNPANSGIEVELLYAGAIVTVAFATAGFVGLGLHQTTAAAKAVSAVGTVSTNTRNLYSTTSTQGGVAQACLAGTATAPILIDILGSGLTGAITTVPFIQTLERWYNGSIVLQPDTAVSIQTGVASGASGLFCCYIWNERRLSS